MRDMAALVADLEGKDFVSEVITPELRRQRIGAGSEEQMVEALDGFEWWRGAYWEINVKQTVAKRIVFNSYRRVSDGAVFYMDKEPSATLQEAVAISAEPVEESTSLEI